MLKELKNKIIILDKSKDEVDSYDINEYVINDYEILDKIKLFDSKLESLTIGEIYSTFYFYFLFCINYFVENKSNNEIIFTLLAKMIVITSLINLKVRSIS